MHVRRNHIWAAAGAVAAGGAAALQLHHQRRISADPHDAVLREPPRGEAIHVHSRDGTQIHAEVFGEPDGQTLVLAHGWTETIPYWFYIIRELSQRGFRVVAYDLRGHGESDRARDGDYSIARFGEDLEAVLEASLGEQQKAVVVGHSLGAMSIAAWAEHHDVQRRVAGAALLNTGVGDLLAEHLLIPVPFIAQLLNRTLPPTILVGSRSRMPRFSTPLGHAAIRYLTFGPAASPAQVAFYERMLVACPPYVRADVGIALSELELRHALPRLTVPTVVIAGAVDRLTPPLHAKRIAGELPQLRELIVLADTGHMAPLERPERVSAVLAELASEIASGSSVVAA